MLVRPEPDGTWTIDGISFDEVLKINPNLYGALCRLRDYESSDIEASVLSSCGYEQHDVYKVFYTIGNDGKDVPGIKTVYCEDAAEARRMADLLKNAGYKGVGINIYSWQMFIEKEY